MYAGFNSILPLYRQNIQRVRWHNTRSRILGTLEIVYQKKPFDMQTEVDFIKKPKHDNDLIKM